MRRSISFINLDNESVRVVACYDINGITDDESTRNNRRVIYSLVCKNCKNLVTVPKNSIRYGHRCPACSVEWQSTEGVLATPRRFQTYDSITLLKVEDEYLWFKGTWGTIFKLMPKNKVETWLSEGGQYRNFEVGGLQGLQGPVLTISPELVQAYRKDLEAEKEAVKDEPPSRGTPGVVRPPVTRAPMAPRVRTAPTPPPPEPKQNPQGLSDEDFADILRKARGEGEGFSPPNPLFSPPTAFRWVLVPKWVYDEFQAQGAVLNKLELASWGVVKHKLTIAYKAPYSTALEHPHWVYAYDAPTEDIPEF